MKLLVALGNPGSQYEDTRHNIGWKFLDLLVEKHGGTWGGKKFQGEFGNGQIYGESCLFLKPQTWMNKSGESVAPAISFYKLKAEDVVLIYDDIDLSAGVVKARKGGGHGGHNGVRSILQLTGNDGFGRIKLGVGRPAQGDVSSWVLGRMSPDELRDLEELMLPSGEQRLEAMFREARS
ncbi:MAG: aminoacyl-tRNA hydrolase [Oligoflexales bacterium]